MKKVIAIILVTLFMASFSQAADEGTVGLRIRFGMKDADQTDWSGSLSTSSGKVESIRGWKWTAGDFAEGSTWTVFSHRQQAQSAAEKKRVKNGEQLAMNENGVILKLVDVKPDAELTFDAKPGKFTFKLSDVPYGKKVGGLNGNVQIDRVPAVEAVVSDATEDDYPVTARAKDGTVYLVYLSFTHGKDFMGARERPATKESGPNTGPLVQGIVKHFDTPEDFDYLRQPTGGEQIYLKVMRDGKWSEAVPVTDGKDELYRPTVAVDGKGKVWVFYSAHLGADKNLDYGNWELMARPFDADGKNGAAPINISNAKGTDFMPSVATDSDGKVWVAWVGGREKNFNVFVASQNGDGFTAPQRISDATGNEWEPNVAAGAKGELAVAWDTYAKGDYDVYIAKRNSGGGFDKPQPVAASLAFEVRPSMAYDGMGRCWIAYEESGDQWGKDFGGLKKKGIPIYNGGRTLGVKVVDSSGQWWSPPDVMESLSDQPKAGPKKGKNGKNAAQPAGVAGTIAPCFPRMAVDDKGHVWMTFRGRPGRNWRVGVGSVWCEYVTRIDSNVWTPALWVPHSNDMLDNRPAVMASTDGKSMMMVFAGDGRGEMNPAKDLPLAHLPGMADDEGAPPTTAEEKAALKVEEDAILAAQKKRGGGGKKRDLDAVNQDLYVTNVMLSDFSSAGALSDAALEKIEPEKPATVVEDTIAEQQAVAGMRDYRAKLGDETMRVWRGEFHRHTEYSFDGNGDGVLLDLWRYAIDAASLDWVGDGDHDYGGGREYSWWTTQKVVTMMTVPDHFVPVYSYERSVGYPEGHRNCIFAERGIRSLPRLPISDADKEAPAPDTNMLYVYLKHFHGICAPHTSATDMGTDWRNNDPEVEPFVEIYQGDRNSYERPDAPRTAVTEAKLKQSTPEKESLGGWRPKGFVNLALQRGYRYAFESSSDHISTHLSYANVFVTDVSREGILDAIRKRRVYASTDNILADVRCKDSAGKEHFMGEEFSTASAPTISVHLVGTQKMAKVTIIKDDKEVHVIQPNEKEVNFTWTDPTPSAGKTSYYYVRGEQVPDMENVTSGELVWASPMWIKYETK